MTINQRQFEQLSEMGISLWQSRQNNQDENDSKTTPSAYLSLTQGYFSELSEQTIFKDILLCLDISQGEISVKEDHLDLGLFNWHFLADNEGAPSKIISFTHNTLISPNLNLLKHSFQLKKQLWQAICDQKLS